MSEESNNLVNLDNIQWKEVKLTDAQFTSLQKEGEIKISSFNTQTDNKYISTVSDSEFTIDDNSRFKYLATYIHNNSKISGIKLIKYKKEKGELQQDSAEEFSIPLKQSNTLVDFLKFLTEANLGSLASGNFVLSDSLNIDPDLQSKLITISSDVEGKKILLDLINSGYLSSGIDLVKIVKSIISDSENPKKIEEINELIKTITESGLITKDLISIGYRKKQLDIFRLLLENKDDYLNKYKIENNLTKPGNEVAWQFFFENNSWIFGYGLNYVFCSNANTGDLDQKLEQVVSGSDFNSAGKRVDALMETMSSIKQFVLVEIKLPEDSLIGKMERSECWSISGKVIDSISQIQKTVMKFKKDCFDKVNTKEKDGTPIGTIYNYTPKSYLIIGDLKEFQETTGVNEDRYSSFQIFRDSINNPEIITYDELYNRAKFIIENNK